MARKPKDQPALLTTPQRLASVLKSARDTMRKDRGLSSDIDRLPQLTWLMFLKFLDDMETERKVAADLEGIRYHPLIEPPYRWRDWAHSALTGDELTAFVNNDEAVGPDGKRDKGLLHYLKNLTATKEHDTREVIKNVFKDTVNRMVSGYLLRDVVNKVDELHFASSEEIHTLGNLYESMLQEMRNAAGDSGEFYTPRPVVKLMVKLTDPKLGETILDPACGTGGFLSETFDHLQPQCKKAQDYDTLQRRSIFGQEAKPLPYLLAQMNLVLHGLEAPNIVYDNSLKEKLTELGVESWVDVILTNPPFGGVEEDSIKNNYPADRRTPDTALLFLQVIMRRLRKTHSQSMVTKYLGVGRAAVVVPNGVLFGDGVAARIKHELLTDFNLHTIVRLPNGVFAPYTPIPTNLLFFDSSGPTKDVWFYEHHLPEGRKTYTKIHSLQDEEFIPILTWWNSRVENERAWKVTAKQLLDNGCNLDVKNPSAKDDFEHLPPEQLVESILTKERQIVGLLEDLRAELVPETGANGACA